MVGLLAGYRQVAPNGANKNHAESFGERKLCRLQKWIAEMKKGTDANKFADAEHRADGFAEAGADSHADTCAEHRAVARAVPHADSCAEMFAETCAVQIGR